VEGKTYWDYNYDVQQTQKLGNDKCLCKKRFRLILNAGTYTWKGIFDQASAQLSQGFASSTERLLQSTMLINFHRGLCNA